MNELDRQLLRHALGLDSSAVAYRNRYICGSTAAWDRWLVLVEKGFAVPSLGSAATYHVTRSGFAAVAFPGETFDPGTFDAEDAYRAQDVTSTFTGGSPGHHARVKALKARSRKERSNARSA